MVTRFLSGAGQVFVRSGGRLTYSGRAAYVPVMVDRAWVGLLAGCCAALLAAGTIGCGNDDDSGSRRLRILVTNDDGVAAEGIDAVVEALVADPDNDVVVSAPDGNRSGSGDMMGPSQRCGDLAVTSSSTKSGYPATAINGCPADAVIYALDALYPAGELPDVVIAGINQGQNVSLLIAGSISGTVGAARTAARAGVPALASSQGAPQPGAEFDYPAGAAAVMSWLEEHREALMAGVVSHSSVDNLNIPSCSSGAIRGTVVVPLAPETDGALSAQNCESSLIEPRDDVEALNNGFITLTAIPLA